MLKKVKLVLCLVLCALMVSSVLMGCGAKTEQPKTDDKTADGESGEKKDSGGDKTEITFWFYPRYNVVGKENGVYERELADAFTKDNPDVSVNVEMLAWNGGPEKVNIAISSNSMPDGLFDFPGRIIGYGTSGVLADLSDVIKPEDKEDIPEGIFTHCTLGDKMYMYPTAVTPLMMAVNKKLYRDAGVENLLPLDKPNRSWTFDEFGKALEGLKKLKGVEPVAFFTGNEQGDASMRMFIQNFGADFVDKDHTKVVINSEAGVKGLQWMLDAYKNGLAAKGAESLTAAEMLDMFYQGKIATSIMFGPGNLNILNKAIEEGTAPKDFDFAFMPMPTVDGGNPKIESQVAGYCVFDNKDAKKIEVSKKFVDFLANSKDNVKATGWFPVRKSMGDLYDNPELKFANTMVEHVADTGYTINNYAKVRALWYPEIQAVLTGEKSPKDALDTFAAKATEVMNEK